MLVEDYMKDIEVMQLSERGKFEFLGNYLSVTNDSLSLPTS